MEDLEIQRQLIVSKQQTINQLRDKIGSCEERARRADRKYQELLKALTRQLNIDSRYSVCQNNLIGAIQNLQDDIKEKEKLIKLLGEKVYILEESRLCSFKPSRDPTLEVIFSAGDFKARLEQTEAEIRALKLREHGLCTHVEKNVMVETDERAVILQNSSSQEKNGASTISHASIETLPDELLLKVFRHVPLEDLSLNVRCVCCRWEKLAKDSVLWKNPKVVINESFSTRDVMQVISHSSVMESFHIEYHRDEQEILKFLTSNPVSQNLRTLVVKRDGDSLSETYMIYLAITKLPRLQELQVETIQESEDLSNEMYCVAASFNVWTVDWNEASDLRKLITPTWKHLDGDLLHLILQRCPHLTELDIRSAPNIKNCDVSYLFDVAKNQLVCLKLSGNSLYNEPHCNLYELEKLHTLHISRWDSSLPYMSNLKLHHLRLSLTCESDSFSLCNLLESMSGLRYLDLSDSSIVGKNVVTCIAQNCSNLEELDLSYCYNVQGDDDDDGNDDDNLRYSEITDEPIESIIMRCNQLKVLKLTGLTSLKGSFLKLIPIYTRSLELLELPSEVTFNTCDAEYLVQSMPALKTKNLFGSLI